MVKNAIARGANYSDLGGRVQLFLRGFRKGFAVDTVTCTSSG